MSDKRTGKKKKMIRPEVKDINILNPQAPTNTLKKPNTSAKK